MKLSTAQIVIVALFIAAGALLAIFALGGGGGDAPTNPDDFLQSVRQQAERATSTEDIIAPLPGSANSAALVPRIRIEPPAPSFGPIPNDQFYDGTVMVHNDGAAPLVIIKINTECPCTQGTMVQETIPPGGSAPMTIRINPGLVLGFHTTKTLTVVTNDPKHRAVEVPVTSHVEPEFSVTPPAIDFGEVTKGSTPTQRIRIAQLNDEPLDILDIGAFPGHVEDFTATYERVPESEWAAPGKAEYDVDITLSPDAAVGSSAREIRVTNTTRRVRDYGLLAHANVIAFYEVTPVQLTYYGAVRDDQPGTVDLTIRANAPIEVDAIRSSVAGLSFATISGSEPNTLTFQVFAGPELKKGEYPCILSFRVRGNGQEVTENRAVSIAVSRSDEF